MTKWDIGCSEEKPQQSAAVSKAATSKPAREQYDEQYQQELGILKQERAEARRVYIYKILSVSFRGFALLACQYLFFE